MAHTQRSRRRHWRRRSPVFDGDTFSPIFGRDPRKTRDGLKQCTHGYLIGGPCPLCDPEGYRRLYGEGD